MLSIAYRMSSKSASSIYDIGGLVTNIRAVQIKRPVSNFVSQMAGGNVDLHTYIHEWKIIAKNKEAHLFAYQSLLIIEKVCDICRGWEKTSFSLRFFF